LKSFSLFSRFSYITRIFSLLLVSSFWVGCSQKSVNWKYSDQQFYQDVTIRYLPEGKINLQGISFAKVDRNPKIDLIGFVSMPNKESKIKVFFNRGEKGIGRNIGDSRIQTLDETIQFLATGDVDNNGVDDLVLITSASKIGPVKILLNNGKGYFFSKEG